MSAQGEDYETDYNAVEKSEAKLFNHQEAALKRFAERTPRFEPLVLFCCALEQRFGTRS